MIPYGDVSGPKGGEGISRTKAKCLHTLCWKNGNLRPFEIQSVGVIQALDLQSDKEFII